MPTTATLSWAPHVHADVLVLCVALQAGYLWALRRLGPRHVHPVERAASRGQVTAWSLGVLGIWVAAGSPVHDIAEQYLYSVHMLQHLLLSLVSPALLLLGMPAWLMRLVLRPPAVLAVVRTVCRPFVALVAFNLVVALTHWTAVVDLTVRSEPAHFAAHLALFATATAMWMPVLSPVMEVPRLPLPVQMLYLFLQSLVPTVPASFLTLGTKPLYRFYELAPRLWGIDALTDMRMAGLIMKLIGGFLLWGVIGVLFFRWAGIETREGVDALKFQDVEREMRRARTRSPAAEVSS